MPLVPMAAAFAPAAGKAGAVMATAFAVGSDDMAHLDLAHHVHDHTAFIRLPFAKSHLWNMIVGPEVAAYNWVHDKVHALFGGSDAALHAGADQGRMVEYYAAGCGHCKHLEPVWKDAATQWGQQSPEDAHKVVWEQKQCLDENWKPGPDFKDCMAEKVQRFPTIKFYPPGAKAGDDFFLARTPEALMDFAKTGINPSPHIMPRAAGDEADVKLVDFYAAACPHCKNLDPVWNDAQKQWDKAIDHKEGTPQSDEMPMVSFVKKQCYDDNWKPGPDSAECKQFGVQGFPTIKLFVPDEHGHGYKGLDYTGARTPEGIVDFLKHETGLEDYLKEKAAAIALETKAGAAAGAVEHHEPAFGVQVPDAIRAKVAEEALKVPEVQVAGEATLQGNTPPIMLDDKALHDFQVDNKPEEAAPAAAPVQEEALKELKQAVKTAIMPLPLLACLPVRRSRASPASPKRVPAPPSRAAQFI